MKLTYSIALALTLTVAGAPRAWAQNAAPVAPVAVPELSARQILIKSAATYAGFEKYKGTCAVITDSVRVISFLGEQKRQTLSVANASMTFERDKFLYISADHSGSRAFSASGYVNGVTITRPAASANAVQPEREVIAKDKDYVLLLKLNTTALGAGGAIFAALQGPSNFNPLSFREADDKLELRPEQLLGTVRCYVVARTDKRANEVTTLWIEKGTFLLRRMQKEQGTNQLKTSPREDGTSDTLDTDYSLTSFAFATTEAK